MIGLIRTHSLSGQNSRRAANVEREVGQPSIGYLQLVKSDTPRVSVLPVAGCKFPAVFLGKVALDVVGLGVGPPCLRVDSEETLLTLTDERAQLAREKGAPVRELIRPSVLGEPLVVNLQKPMPAENRLEYAIQADSFSMGDIRTGALCGVRRRGL